MPYQAEQTLCPDCGRLIPRDAARGLCPACTIRLVLPGLLDDGMEIENHESAPGDLVTAPLRTIGPWLLHGIAGEGAFGFVYEASQQKPVRRRAALKLLKESHLSREAADRFASECETLALLDHPGIARVLDAGHDGGRSWFAMEWIDGARPLTDYCDAHNLSRHDRLRLFCQVCDAVAHAHHRGVIHRDLKPSNLLVDARGQVKVIDFGIARATERLPEQGALLTMAGQVLGTPAYMSPEQAAGHGSEADTRSDIYSLGAVLYELLTGRPPFSRAALESTSLQTALKMVAEDAPPAPSSLVRSLRGPLEWILFRALEKDPGRRYETAGALARDISSSLEGETVLAAPPSAAYRFRVLVRKHRAAIIGGAAVFTALLAGLATTTAMYQRARTQERMARASGEEARRNASHGDHMTAETFFKSGRPLEAAMHLARAVRTDPRNTAAAERLLAELAWTDFSQPVCAPITMPEFVRRAEFSPDANRLAVLCHESQFGPGLLTLFAFPEIRPLVTLPGVMACAFSPDSTLLAVASESGSLDFHHAADGAPTPLPSLPLQALASRISWPRMDRVACIAADALTLWNPADQNLLVTIPQVEHAADPGWSPALDRLACVQRDGRVPVINADTGEVVTAAKSTNGHGTTAFAADGALLAVQNLEGPLQLFSTVDGSPQLHPMQSGSAPFAVRVLPDGDLAVTSGFDGIATLWNLNTGFPRPHPLPPSDNAIPSSHGGTLLLTGDSPQSEAILWDTDRGQPARAPIRMAGGVLATALSRDGRWLACGGRLRLLTIHDLAPRAARPLVLPFPALSWHLAWSADNGTLTALGANGRTAIWDAASGKPLHRARRWERHLAAVASGIPHNGPATGKTVAMEQPAGQWLPPRYRVGAPPEAVANTASSPDGRWLVVCLADGRLRLSNLHTGLHHEEQLNSPAVSITFSGDARFLAVGFANGDLLRTDPEVPKSRTLERVHQTAITALAFLDPDRRLICGAADGSVWVTPPAGSSPRSAASADRSPREAGPFEATGAVRQVEVSADGQWFATSTVDATARLWRSDTGQPASPVLAHRSGAGPGGLILAFSPDSRLLATGGSFDNAVRLWAVPSGEPRATFQHPSRVSCLGFSGPTRLASTSETAGTPSLWLWDLESATSLLPPLIMPCGGRACTLALAPDGRRAAVGSDGGAIVIYDLPPVLRIAPTWLADFAEGRVGAMGNGIVPAISRPDGLPLADIDNSPAGHWAEWIGAGPARRSLSPLVSARTANYLQALEQVGSRDCLREITHLRPSLAARLAVRALESAWLDDRVRAESLALRAVRLDPEDPFVEDLCGFVLATVSTGAEAWPILLRDLLSRPADPLAWSNAARYLQRRWHAKRGP